MRKIAILAAFLAYLPVAGFASTLVNETGGPFDVQTDSLFFGVALSGAGGPGTFTIDFINPSGSVTAIADAAVTTQAVTNIFVGLTMSWLDGVSLNTLVQAAGIDTLTTVFSTGFQSQRLQFEWADSPAGTGFGFDVRTTASAVPVPAALPLFAASLVGLGLMSRRRRAVYRAFPV